MEEKDISPVGAQVLRDNPAKGQVFERVAFTSEEIKTIMTKTTVRIGLFHIVIAGLPFSGKTTLLKSMIDPKYLQGDSALSLCEIVINRNILGGHVWKEAPKPEAGVNFLLFAFARYFVENHKLPMFDKRASLYKIYDDPEIQEYFECFFDELRKVLLRFDNEKDIEQLLIQSLSLANVYDVGVNKAVYDFLMAVDGKNRNFFLVNVLDMFKCDEGTAIEPVDLSKYKHYQEKYCTNELHLYKSRSAIQHFTALLQTAAMNDLKTNTVIVGTHAEEFIKENSEVNQRKRIIMDLIKSFAEKYGVNSSLIMSEMIAVDARCPEECEKVKRALIDLININKKEVEMDLPVSFIFLRCVLFNTGRIFISRTSLIDYAKKCFVSENKIDEFLEFFRKCGSIISSDIPKEFLYDYFILLPCDFLRDLNELYCIHTNDSIPQDIKERAKYGFVSDKLLQSLWPNVPGSEDSMSLSDLYSKVLQNVLIMAKIGEGEYFMPSLRYEYCELDPDTDSLIITTNIRFNIQCAITKYFVTQFSEFVQVVSYPCFNVTIFEWKEPEREKLKVMIKIHRNYVEVALFSMSGHSPFTDKYLIADVVSRVKLACVTAMKDYMFPHDFIKLSVICPKSPKEKPHFIAFRSSVDMLQCQECEGLVTSDDPKILWACEGGNIEDFLNPAKLLAICTKLCSVTSNDDKIQSFMKKISLALKSNTNLTSGRDLSDRLFDVLYNWYNHDPSLTKQDLIKAFEEHGLDISKIKICR